MPTVAEIPGYLVGILVPDKSMAKGVEGKGARKAARKNFATCGVILKPVESALCVANRSKAAPGKLRRDADMIATSAVET